MYKILKINHKNYQYIIFPLFSDRELFDISEVEKKLIELGVNNVTILFDFLVFLGDSNRRFIHGRLNDDIIENLHFDANVDENIRKISYQFYTSKPELLTNSIMPKKMIMEYLNQTHLVDRNFHWR